MTTPPDDQRPWSPALPGRSTAILHRWDDASSTGDLTGGATTFVVDIVDPTPAAFGLAFAVRFDRLGKRRCRDCRRRRIAFALRACAGPAVILSSPVLCAACAGFHSGAR